MKGLAQNPEPRENNHPSLQLLSALWGRLFLLILLALRATTFQFWFTLSALMVLFQLQQAARSSEKALKAHCKVPAQHQTAGGHS